MNQKKPAKPAFPKSIPPSNAAASSPPNDNKDPTTSTNPSTAAPPQPPRQTTSTPPPGHAPARTTLADWAAANDEDEYLWGAAAAEKRQRGGRRAAKKKKKQLAANHHDHRETDWDEIYDPARPTNVDEYLRSDERVREVQEWKAVLYAHRRRDRRGRRGSYDEDEDSEEDSEVEGRAGLGSELQSGSRQLLYKTTSNMALDLKLLTVYLYQINSLLRQTTPSHRRPCHHQQQ